LHDNREHHHDHRNRRNKHEDNGFYESMRRQHGFRTVRLLKKISSTMKKITSQRSRRHFLLRCRDEGVFPNFVENICKHLKPKLTNSYLYNIKIKILNSEIRDASHLIKKLEFSYNFSLGEISPLINKEDLDRFMKLEIYKDGRRHELIKRKHMKKLERIISSSSNIYHSFKHTINSNVDLWVKNISSTEIPQDIMYVFALGPKFGLPTNNKNKFMFELISSIVPHIQRLKPGNPQMINKINFNISVILHKYKNSKENNNELNYFHRKLQNDIKKANRFLKNNPEIILTKADKGNISIIMNKSEYDRKMFEMLEDKNTYSCLNQNIHIKNVQTQSNNIIKKLHESKHIDKQTYERLICHNGTMAKIYGLVKIHKEGYPLRPVVSTIDTPTYKLSRFISDIIKPLSLRSNHIVKDSFSLVNQLRNTNFEDSNDLKLVSFDVVSLYTNTSVNIAIDHVNENYDTLQTSISKEKLIELIKFICNNATFSFKGRIYKQIFGVPMGDPLSPILANIMLIKLETIALNSLNYQIPLYVRYVDDILLLIPNTKIDETLNIFNNLDQRLQFTMEKPIVNSINFLDITIKLTNNQISTNWYHKDTWSKKYLNYFSNHPISYKRSMISGLVDRAILLSNEEFHNDNIELVKEVLLLNSYPTPFIEKNINNRIAFLKKRQHHEKREATYLRLPYDRSLKKPIEKLLKPVGLIPAWSTIDTTRSLFSKLKDPEDKFHQSKLVYKVECKDCECCYVGETKQYLHKRIYQHKYNINKQNQLHSGLCKHAIEEGHTFNFDETKILHKSPQYSKRITLESLYIHTNTNTVNTQTEVQHLDIYKNLF